MKNPFYWTELYARTSLPSFVYSWKVYELEWQISVQEYIEHDIGVGFDLFEC